MTKTLETTFAVVMVVIGFPAGMGILGLIFFGVLTVVGRSAERLMNYIDRCAPAKWADERFGASSNRSLYVHIYLVGLCFLAVVIPVTALVRAIQLLT